MGSITNSKNSSIRDKRLVYKHEGIQTDEKGQELKEKHNNSRAKSLSQVP